MSPSDDPGGPPSPPEGPAPPENPPAPVADSDQGPRSRIGIALGLAITAIAIVLAISYAAARTDDDARIVKEVVGLHELASEASPPVLTDDSAPPGFADHALANGWVPIGSRRDRVEGRDTVTVFWEKAGVRVGYTTVSGAPVTVPRTGRQTGRRGVLLRSFDDDGRTAVAWNENGHTAVISGIRISRAALYNLAGGRARTRATPGG